MAEQKRYPSGIYDVILGVIQLVVIAELIFRPIPFLLPFGNILFASGLFALFLAHWAPRRSWPWWTLSGIGIALALSSLVVLALHK